MLRGHEGDLSPGLREPSRSHRRRASRWAMFGQSSLWISITLHGLLFFFVSSALISHGDGTAPEIIVTIEEASLLAPEQVEAPEPVTTADQPATDPAPAALRIDSVISVQKSKLSLAHTPSADLRARVLNGAIQGTLFGQGNGGAGGSIAVPTVGLFGTMSTANSVVFVVDVSGSMVSGDKSAET